MFVFNNLMEIADWLEKHSQTLSGKAGNEKGSKLQFTKGQIYELQNLVALIRSKSIVLTEQEPKPIPVVVKRETVEKSPERPSAANNDFLRWVREHYSPRQYQSACTFVEEGVPEDMIRAKLSECSK